MAIEIEPATVNIFSVNSPNVLSAKNAANTRMARPAKPKTITCWLWCFLYPDSSANKLIGMTANNTHKWNEKCAKSSGIIVGITIAIAGTAKQCAMHNEEIPIANLSESNCNDLI